ncbi:MAG: sulfite exporter TauE/SafE family protein [Gemmatimonadota bacterium]
MSGTMTDHGPSGGTWSARPSKGEGPTQAPNQAPNLGLDRLIGLARREPEGQSTLMFGFIGSALLAGFVGSLHCIGMCGGFAVACGGRARDTLPWHAGRTTTYAILGGLVQEPHLSIPGVKQLATNLAVRTNMVARLWAYRHGGQRAHAPRARHGRRARDGGGKPSSGASTRRLIRPLICSGVSDSPEKPPGFRSRPWPPQRPRRDSCR